MTVAAAQMKEVLQVYRSGLKQLEEQLVFFKRKREREMELLLQTDLANQKFFYRSDANGLIQLQNDSSYVVEQIFAFPSGSRASATSVPSTFRLSLVDLSSGRDLTHIDVRIPNTADEALPVEVFSPSITIGDTFFDQDDYWFWMVGQYLLPRAAVVGVRVSNPSNAEDTLLPNVVFGGHKVF